MTRSWTTFVVGSVMWLVGVGVGYASQATALTWNATARDGYSSAVASQPSAGLQVEETVFGKMPDGEPVKLFVLKNEHGVTIKVMNYGATLTSVETPDRKGHFDNITLYLDTCDDYLRGHPLFGSVVGRFANRIGGARFSIDGTQYAVTANAGKNHIHGGKQGFQKLLWDAAVLRESDRVGMEFSLTRPDGDEGYPGKLKATARYWLNNQNELTLEYTATTDKPTHVNLTNHAYWNLGGASAGNVLDHQLTINADRYLPTDDKKIPTGEVKAVQGTPLDFRQPMAIGTRIDQVPGGYDHCYVLNKKAADTLSFAARVVDPESGRVMDVYTTQPGVQLYTANGLKKAAGPNGPIYGPHHAVCLETQHYPDAPNKPHFPSTLLRPGTVYHEITVHRFGVRN